MSTVDWDILRQAYGTAADIPALPGIEALLLAATIELDRQSPAAPPIPSDIRPAYERALRIGRELCGGLHAAGSRPDDPQRVAIAFEVFQRDFARARTLLGDDEQNGIE